jgi:hypothetical protein
VFITIEDDRDRQLIVRPLFRTLPRAAPGATLAPLQIAAR